MDLLITTTDDKPHYTPEGRLLEHLVELAYIRRDATRKPRLREMCDALVDAGLVYTVDNYDDTATMFTTELGRETYWALNLI